MQVRPWSHVPLSIVLAWLGAFDLGCASRIPQKALAMEGPTLEIRQRSTRRFTTTDEKFILSAAAGVLQDLGFTIDESETALGLIVASKDRSAVDAGQVAGKITLAILFSVDIAVDETQKFRASIVARPSGQEIAVRVSFQRIVWNENGQISRLERIDDPKIYQEFFDKLSKAVFLEAHEI